MSNSEAMTKKDNTKLILARESQMSSLPAHLQQSAGGGKEEIQKFIRPGRIKVIQSNRTTQFDAFEEGQVIVTPVNILLAENDQPFHFVPLFFFPEWCTVNPYQTKDILPMIRERTLDPASLIAAKSRDKDKRGADKCPEKSQFNLKHKQYFNFICWLVANPEFARLPVLLSFSGGELGKGQRLCDVIAMREPAICHQVFEGKVPPTKRHNDSGEWFGIDVTSPTVNEIAPFVMDPDEAEALWEEHKKLKAAHADRLIQVDYEDEESEAGAVEATAESKF